ncbi:c-type cytochrome [Amaricoccus solimangrovi]|uniref:Cytochrome c n=1 Tax=Amaricoccus solimangrovi TaxID=2589815 RepID=A0A501WQ36_9RHOB|nr:cytochrome c [Amaricoccus solimangrovi]TPE51893.1 cytochrome c [Amaricoccus solimangrovi]
MTRAPLLTGLAVAMALASAPGGAADLDGAALFETHCAACHGAGGVGTPGLAPPLDRPDFWQALGENAPEYIGGVVTKGLNMRIAVRGEQYMGTMMPPVAGASDEELAAVATWVLDTLGGTQLAVAPADIAAARDTMTMGALKNLRPETQ